MKEILSTTGNTTLVDDKDFKKLNKYKWYYSNTGYFYTSIKINNRWESIAMHRLILNLAKGDNLEVDHIDCNKSNNQRINLRICKHVENMRNLIKPSNNFSGYKGVCWNINAGKWKAQLMFEEKRIHLGYFNCLIKAAKAYDRAARQYFGEFAKTNF